MTESSDNTSTDNAPDSVTDETTEAMLAAVNQRMPFGKYKGSNLLDLPEYYLVWFKQRGYPKGKLGTQMALIYEIKLNGLEKLVRPMIKEHGQPELHRPSNEGQSDTSPETDGGSSKSNPNDE